MKINIGKVHILTEDIYFLTNLGGALSAMTTMMWTGREAESGGIPLSTARTTSMYSPVEEMSRERARRRVPNTGSREKVLPILPASYFKYIYIVFYR